MLQKSIVILYCGILWFCNPPFLAADEGMHMSVAIDPLLWSLIAVNEITGTDIDISLSYNNFPSIGIRRSQTPYLHMRIYSKYFWSAENSWFSGVGSESAEWTVTGFNGKSHNYWNRIYVEQGYVWRYSSGFFQSASITDAYPLMVGGSYQLGWRF